MQGCAYLHRHAVAVSEFVLDPVRFDHGVYQNAPVHLLARHAVKLAAQIVQFAAALVGPKAARSSDAACWTFGSSDRLCCRRRWE